MKLNEHRLLEYGRVFAGMFGHSKSADHLPDGLIVSAIKAKS